MLRVTDVADRPPRKCASTGRADGPFIDFQVQIDPPGPVPTNLYLHTLIVEEAAGLLGMVPAKQLDELRDEIRLVEERVSEIREVLTATGDLEEALQNLKTGDGTTIAAVLADLKERIG